ncbi:MAG: sigma-70 family RNA polymerase sigma factor [Cytophagales bacterium]|nr:sigma-70 family RNA polymerase sigma factor [Cytophagales bacterium]
MRAIGYDQHSDYQLWQAFRKGSQPAFDLIFERHVRLLCHYGRKFTADTTLVEDCVQDLFVELWERRAALGDTDSIRFYLYRSLRRRIVRALMAAQRFDPGDEASDGAFGVHLSPEHTLIAAQLDAERQHVLGAALAQLPKRQQEALQLKYFDNLSNQQIAQVMDISVDSVYKLVCGALGSLKKRIRKVSLALLLAALICLGG